MKTLIIGSNGLLGHYLVDVFSDWDSVAWDRNDCDVTNIKEMEKKIQNLLPTVIINATGYTQVDKAEQEIQQATMLNTTVVQALSAIAHSIDAVFVHYSTDYVFDGTRKDGYSEEDFPTDTPMNVYGATKLNGEVAVFENAPQSYLIRTQWLFGLYGKDFIDTMLSLQGKKQVSVVNDQYGVPTYARDVAEATKQLIARKHSYGVYHIVNEGGPVTWYDYARFIFETYGHSTKESIPSVTPTTTQKTVQYGTKAQRPQFSLLKNTKYPALRHWHEPVKEHILSVTER